MNTGNSKYSGKYLIYFYYLNHVKNIWLFKQKVIIMQYGL